MRNLSFKTFLISSLLITYFSLGWYKAISVFSLPALLSIFLFFIFLTDNLLRSSRRFPIHKINFLFLLCGLLFILLLFSINGQNTSLNRVRDLTIIFIIFSVFYDYFLKSNSIKQSFILRLASYWLIFSSAVAFFQFFSLDFAWNLRELLPGTEDDVVNQQIEERLRPAGLSYYSVQLSYQLYIGFIFIILLSQIEKWNSSKIILMSLLMLIGGIFGANLSLILSSAIFIISFVFISQPKLFTWRNIFFVTILAAPIIVSPLIGRVTDFDSSALSRLTFGYIGFQILVDHPLGVPIEQLNSIKLEYLNSLFLGGLPLGTALLETSFHNTFLSLGIELGWIGLIIYILSYGYLLNYFFTNYRSRSAELKIFYLVGFCANLGYLAQILTHNAGPFHSDPYFWIMNGSIIGFIESKRKLLAV